MKLAVLLVALLVLAIPDEAIRTRVGRIANDSLTIHVEWQHSGLDANGNPVVVDHFLLRLLADDTRDTLAFQTATTSPDSFVVTPTVAGSTYVFSATAVAVGITGLESPHAFSNVFTVTIPPDILAPLPVDSVTIDTIPGGGE